MSNAQSGLTNATAVRDPAAGFPPSDCQAEVPTRRIISEEMLEPVLLTSVKLPAPANAWAGVEAIAKASNGAMKCFMPRTYFK